MKKISSLLIICSLLLFTACRDKYNLSQDNLNVDYTPEFALPLLNTDVITEDLLTNIDTNLISTGSDNVLQVVFKDTLKTIEIGEFITIDNDTVTDLIKVPPITIADKSQTDSITMLQLKAGLNAGTQVAIDAALDSSKKNPPVPVEVPDIADQSAGTHNIANLEGFSSVTFSKGKMAITVTNKFNIPLRNLVMDLKSGGVTIGTFTYPLINPGTSLSDEITLDNRVMKADMILDITSFGSPGSGSSKVLLQEADVLVFAVALTELEVVAAVAKIPTQDLVTDTMLMDLPLTNGEKLKEVTFNTMKMDYSINFGVRENAAITISLPYASKNGGAPFSEVINITHVDGVTPTIKKGTLNLDGYTIDLTAGGTKNNTIEARIKVGIVSSDKNIAFDTSNVVSYSFISKDASVKEVKGYFGQQKVSFADEEVSTGITNDELLNSITLTNPTITMTFDNGFGIPMAFETLNLKATGGTEDVTLTGLSLPFGITAAANSTSTETSQFVIGAPATNIDDAINSQATKFIVGGEAKLNPDGETSTDNFANESSKLTVTMNAEVPMQGTIKGMVILDTLDLDMGEALENAAALVLRSTISNEFPLDGNIQIVFTDGSYEALDSLVSPGENGTFMKASVSNSSGETTAPSTKSTNFTLNEAKLANLGQTKKAILKVKISSGNEGKDVMKILSTYKMNVKLGVIAKIKAGGLIGGE